MTRAWIQRRWRPVLMALSAVLGVVVGGVGQPAGALTPTERFVAQVHEDFLLRPPSSAELTLWTTYLGSASRASMVAALLDGNEFKTLWAVGVRYYYLSEVDLEDPQFASDVAALGSSDDFVASEVAVLARARYYDLSGGTNTSFMTALYDDVLFRPPDPSGLSYWVGRLNAGTSTRTSVATYFIRSGEAAGRRVAGPAGATTCAATVLEDVAALRSGSYCLVLDRMADPSGASYWTGQLSASGQLPGLWASLAGSAEYYDNAQ